MFNITNGEELTKLYLKSVTLHTCVFEFFLKVSIIEFGINPFYGESVYGYNWQYGLKCTSKILQTLQDKEVLILLLENIICGGLASVMGDNFVKSVELLKKIFIDKK